MRVRNCLPAPPKALCSLRQTMLEHPRAHREWRAVPAYHLIQARHWLADHWAQAELAAAEMVRQQPVQALGQLASLQPSPPLLLAVPFSALRQPWALQPVKRQGAPLQQLQAVVAEVLPLPQVQELVPARPSWMVEG